MSSSSSTLAEKLWGYAARRFAAGKTAVQVAQALGQPVAAIRAVEADPDFAELVDCYRCELEWSDEEKILDQRQAVLDGINYLIEQRDVRTILWVAGRMGLFGKSTRERTGEAESTSDPFAAVSKLGPSASWDDVYDHLPPDLQRDYSEFDKTYVPRAGRVAMHTTSSLAAADETAGQSPEFTTVSDDLETSPEIDDQSEANDNRALAESAPASGAVSVPAPADSPTKPPNFTYWRKEKVPRHHRIRAP